MAQAQTLSPKNNCYVFAGFAILKQHDIAE